MAGKPEIARWPGFRDAHGIDREYERVRETAQRELDETVAGPRDGARPPDGTDMKNPDGEFEAPSPMTPPSVAPRR